MNSLVFGRRSIESLRNQNSGVKQYPMKLLNISISRWFLHISLSFVPFSSFWSLLHKNALMCVPHVQHDYFSSFSQSYCCNLRRCRITCNKICFVLSTNHIADYFSSFSQSYCCNLRRCRITCTKISFVLSTNHIADSWRCRFSFCVHNAMIIAYLIFLFSRPLFNSQVLNFQRKKKEIFVYFVSQQ